ncbi:peptidase S8/S53 [Calothrix sp. NIES-4101]|nr:peptidase S8/S53 [Calothrix sp. NIES-4101]
MPINYKSNNFVSKQELNITSTSAITNFDSNSSEIYNTNSIGYHNSSSYNYNSDKQSPTRISDREITSTSYNSSTGYGLVDAAAAVAKSVGQNTFADVPNLGGNNWGDDMVKAPEVWAKGYTGQGVVVAVLDTGVDRNHEDLKNNIWKNTKEIEGNGVDDDGNGYVDDVYGWNFDGNNNNTLDVDGHGTHVSGTIAAEKNDKGATGVAYNAKIMPVKVLDDTGSGSYDSIAKGIRYAVDNGAKVINMSLGGGSSNPVMQEALQYASSRGTIVVMAAGNSGGSSPIYPARYAKDTGIAVGAVDKDGKQASFSNRAGNEQLTYVTAPGVSIYSTVPNNGYENYSGTSMATPHVAGVVALMLSANPNLSDSQVRQILADTSGKSEQDSNPSLPSFNFGDIFSGFNPFSSGIEFSLNNRSYDYTTGFGIPNNIFGNNSNIGLDWNAIANNSYKSVPIPSISTITSSEMSEYWSLKQTTSDMSSMTTTNPSNPSDPENIFNRYAEVIMAPFKDYLDIIPTT